LYSLIILSDKFRNNEDYSFQITQNDSVYFKRKLKIKSFGLPVFEKQNESITLSFDSSYVLNGIILNEINKNLTEGDYTIRILDDGDKEIETLKFSVKWFNKPFSLKDSDFALEMISYIEPESSYKELLKSTLNSEKLLEQYWKTKDPTPGTSFNELMEVFYERVDFAEINYRSISESSGAKTDRGKIYIINGNPDRIERGVNYDGKITETWFYENPKRVFIFVDKRGDGSFKLEQ
jgi:GWxTD domain-containing protein